MGLGGLAGRRWGQHGTSWVTGWAPARTQDPWVGQEGTSQPAPDKGTGSRMAGCPTVSRGAVHPWCVGEAARPPPQVLLCVSRSVHNPQLALPYPASEWVLGPGAWEAWSLGEGGLGLVPCCWTSRPAPSSVGYFGATLRADSPRRLWKRHGGSGSVRPSGPGTVALLLPGLTPLPSQSAGHTHCVSGEVE